MSFKTWSRNFKPGDWTNYRGANGSAQAFDPGAGVDQLESPGKMVGNSVKGGFKAAWDSRLPNAGSVLMKDIGDVPGMKKASQVLDTLRSKARMSAPVGTYETAEQAAKGGFRKMAGGALKSALNPLNPVHLVGAAGMAAYDGFNTSTDEYRARMGLASQDQADNPFGDTVVRTAGIAQDLGNKVTFFGLAGRASEALARAIHGGPLPDLPLDPATAAKGKAIAARPAPVAPAAQPIDKAKQQADAMAYGVAADPDGSYANAEAARFSNQPAPPPNHAQLQKQAMDPNATEADRIKAVGQQYGVDPKNITFRQMGPDSVFKVGKNTFTDGSDPTSRVSNMNEPWTPEKAATLERVGQMERYNNYLRAGYDPATANRLMEGKSAQENQVAVIGDPTKKSFRDVAMDMLERSTRMQYGGHMRDAAIELLGLAQKEDQFNATNATEMAKVNAERETGLAKARAGNKEPMSYRDMLAMQQFGLDKQKFDYQQKKDEAEYNRGVVKDKAALSAEQKAAAAKSHEDRMKALFTDPESGQIDQAAVADFNRRAAGFAADLGKNIDQLTSEEFDRLQSLKAMHDLAKDRAGLLFHKGSYKDNADYRAYEPIMKGGKVEVEQGIGGTFIKLRNGSLVNLEDLKKKGGLPILRWFGQSTSPSNYGVDPTTLPQ